MAPAHCLDATPPPPPQQCPRCLLARGLPSQQCLLASREVAITCSPIQVGSNPPPSAGIEPFHCSSSCQILPPNARRLDWRPPAANCRPRSVSSPPRSAPSGHGQQQGPPRPVQTSAEAGEGAGRLCLLPVRRARATPPAPASAELGMPPAPLLLARPLHHRLPLAVHARIRSCSPVTCPRPRPPLACWRIHDPTLPADRQTACLDATPAGARAGAQTPAVPVRLHPVRTRGLSRGKAASWRRPRPRPAPPSGSSPSWHCTAAHATDASGSRPAAVPVSPLSSGLVRHTCPRPSARLTVHISCSSMHPSTSVLLANISRLAPASRCPPT